MVKYFGNVLLLIGLLLVFQNNLAAQKENQKKASAETGKELYQKYCLTCHQADGGLCCVARSQRP